MEDNYDEKSFVRYEAIEEIINDYLNCLNYQGIFYSLNKNLLKKAIESYYSELNNWKDYFHIKRIDRHKVSALTIHYLLEYCPIENNLTRKEIPYDLIINECVALHIGLSRLKNSVTISQTKTLNATMIRLLSKHKYFIKESKHNTYYIPFFIENLSTIMFLIENSTFK